MTDTPIPDDVMIIAEAVNDEIFRIAHDEVFVLGHTERKIAIARAIMAERESNARKAEALVIDNDEAAYLAKSIRAGS